MSGLIAGMGLFICANAGHGDSPIAVTVDFRKPRRVVLVKDQLPSPVDAEPGIPTPV